MSWFGKLAGGRTDEMGGPIAEVAQAALDGEVVPAEVGHLSSEESSQSVFFVTTFSLLAKMAKADGVVSLVEIRAVDDFIEKILACDAATRRFATRVFAEARDSEHKFETFAKQFKKLFAKDSHMLVELLEILYRVAMADGELHPSEGRMLSKVAKIFKVSPQTTRFLHDEFVHGAEHNYAVLRCDPTASVTAIESNYRALLREYDPETVIAHGLPREFEMLAKKKITEIDAAWASICRARGVGTG